jgi:TetR/AcrR family transcriptional regulator
MKPATRTSIKRQEKEKRILEAAEKVFAEAGFGGATMQLIADVAGLPKANIHYYFSTKEELYRRIVSQIFDDWLEAAQAFDDSSGPAEGIGGYIDAKMEIARRRPMGSKVWASEVMHGAPVIQDYLEEVLIDWPKGRAQVIQKWNDAGQMRNVSPRYLLYMIWATTQHYSDFDHQIETLNGGAPLGDTEWAEANQTVKDIILTGLGISPGMPA